MGAERAQRRKMTAKEAAARLGVSERTVQRIAAEPREEFLARAAARREQAATLRAQGLSYKRVAEEMGCSIGAVSRLLHDARRYAEDSTP